MEYVLKRIESDNEEVIQTTLEEFNEKNKANFSLGETTAVRKQFCTALLQNLTTTNAPNSWSLATKALALTSLRILVREHDGIDEITCPEGLRPIVELAELSEDVKESCFASGDKVPASKVNALMEAVKCLCNVVLNNRHLAPTYGDLGCLRGLALRLGLCHRVELSHDVMFFDLRLLFLITACGLTERAKFRRDFNGLPILINLIDTIVIGHNAKSSPWQQPQGVETNGSGQKDESGEPEVEPDSKPQEVVQSTSPCGPDSEPQEMVQSTSPCGPDSEPQEVVQSTSPCGPDSEPQEATPPCRLHPLRDSVYCLSAPIADKQMDILSEALKIVFNQTVADTDYDDEDIQLYTRLAHLIQLLVTSTPLHHSKAATNMITHCVEVLVNIPHSCAAAMLLPRHVQVMPILQLTYPRTYVPSEATVSEATGVEASAAVSPSAAGAGNESLLYCMDLDRVFDDWSMAAIISLLNYLHFRLSSRTEYHSLPPVLSALRVLSKGHRSIRRFLKAEILPPLREVGQRPEEGESLKSRVVRQMTAGSHGAEEITAEFLFVLCKENASRLIKHTGYGNAAGLLLAHGLLGGGTSLGEMEYSSDSEPSDTEEYSRSRSQIDPVTGGPARHEEETPLDKMTEEEKEEEAGKLQELFRQLDRHGIIKVMPLDQQQRPMKEESPSSDEDLD